MYEDNRFIIHNKEVTYRSYNYHMLLCIYNGLFAIYTTFNHNYERRSTRCVYYTTLDDLVISFESSTGTIIPQYIKDHLIGLYVAEMLIK